MAPTRVLVLDDNQGIRLGVRLYLEACGFEVLDAADCASALQLLSERAKIAIVQPDMKAVVLTAYPSESLAETAQRCGALRFLTKPIELGELRLLLDELAGNGATPPGA